MTGSQTYITSNSRSNRWPPFAPAPAALRRRLRPAPLTWPAMATLFCLLLAVSVAFGITALHQRERYEDATRQVAQQTQLLSQQTAELNQRTARADGLDERLLELALSAFHDGPEDVVSGLQELQGRHPYLARSDSFAQLWRSAQNALTLQTQFETATGGDQVQEFDLTGAPAALLIPTVLLIKAQEGSWVRIAGGAGAPQ